MSSKTVENNSKAEKEKHSLKKFRLQQFVNLLGPDWPIDDILTLTESEVSYHDLEKLLKKDCPKELAIKILL